MDQHLAFLVDQAAHIEPEVYRTKYPDIQYHDLVPIDMSANEYASNVTHFSMDMVGRAEFINQRTSEVPTVETHGARHIVRVESIGAGYDYTLEEIGQAMMLGIALTTDKAMASRRAAEEFMDDLVLMGSEDQAWDGLLNSSLPTHSDAANNAAASSRFWNQKSGSEIIRDVNSALSGLWAESRTVELADHVLLPPRPYEYIANTPRSDDSDMSIYEWIMKHNLYTARTGNRLTIREVRGLEAASETNGNGRLIAYRKDPTVLKLHLPMPLRYFAPQVRGFRYVVPAMLRTGGLEIRRPKAIRYLDEIWDGTDNP